MNYDAEMASKLLKVTLAEIADVFGGVVLVVPSKNTGAFAVGVGGGMTPERVLGMLRDASKRGDGDGKVLRMDLTTGPS